MFRSALFITAQNLEQPKCPSSEEWINKMWYIDIVKYYYLAIKRNEVLIHDTYMEEPWKHYHR